VKITPTPLAGVLIIEPKVFADHRGFFLETYNEQRYQENGLPLRFVQDNHSRSTRGILRGLHYQIKKPQGKLVWCVQGEIYDVAVDVRRGSPTYGQWFGMTLDSTKKQQLYVPPGLAHGFAVVSETAEVYYKCTDFYDPKDEGGIIWNDPDLKITWPIDQPTLSPKDAALPALKNATLAS
jgi:dTDP-4-dehydrorhamnose 3,5-epimerase